MEVKIPLSHTDSTQISWWDITSFSKNNVTSEGAVSHNVVYYQQLSIARYQVIIMLTIILSNYQ